MISKTYLWDKIYWTSRLKMAKILIVGNGFLGKNLHNVAIKNKISIEISDYKKNGIDVTNIASIDKFFEIHCPEIVVNCSVISQVDECEKNPKHALNVNAYGAENVAKACKKYNTKLIHISTDSVFNGKKGMYTESDKLEPKNEYARTKKIGEELVRKTLDNHIIIRTNFYGKNENGNNLFDWILNSLENNEKITGFSDIIFNPLEINNLCSMIIELISSKFLGTIHLTSDEIFSKFEFCKKIAFYLEYPEELVKEGISTNTNLIAKRPLNTTLSNKLSKTILKTKQITLQTFLEEFKAKL
jgi:dTDP-4-dehydrorhamnose reductase